MQTENWLGLLKCAQVHEKKKNKNIDMKYRKRSRKKKGFFIFFFFVCLENQNGKQNGILQYHLLWFHLNQSTLYIF